jgi:hypothetical protein
MSINAIVDSCSSGNVNKSCNRFRAKTVLPAPIKAILVIFDSYLGQHDIH